MALYRSFLKLSLKTMDFYNDADISDEEDDSEPIIPPMDDEESGPDSMM